MRQVKPKALSYALSLLKSRDHSVGEIRDKLKGKKYSSGEIERVINFLLDKDFLDDQRFAANFVRTKKALRSVGKYYLRRKLLEKHIDEEIIEKTLAALPDKLEEINQIADSWLLKHGQTPQKPTYQKLCRFLLSRGFDWEQVQQVAKSKVKNCC